MGGVNIKPVVVPKVTARGKIGDHEFYDTNQEARPASLADPDKPTLITDKVAANEIKDGKSYPNGNMRDAHAEVGVIQQEYDSGLTK
jgi:filamentous hemagglutinin